jgi:phosphoribosylformylglycinamidine synthase
MLTFSGAPALSDFRLEKVLAAMRERIGHASGIDTRYVHFVDVETELTRDETNVLEALLRYGPAAQPGEPAGQLLLVVPRFGTVSPWSTKATDIAHVCGLRSVRRIERGVAYFVRSERPLAAAEIELAAP